MADFVVFPTWNSARSSFLSDTTTFNSQRDATLTDENSTLTLNESTAFTYVGIPDGPNDDVGPYDMYSFSIVGGGSAIWMAGNGQSGGIVIPLDQTAYDIFRNGTSYSIASGSAVSSAQYSNFYNPPPPNNPPSLGGTPPNATATEDVTTAIDLSAYNVSDGDGDPITLTFAVNRGSIASIDGNGTTGGVTIASSGTATMTLAGTTANLNTYLNDTSKITFTTGANDTTTATLTVTPNDGTDNGTADTVAITITSVNDEPTLTATGSNPTFTEGGASASLFSGSSISTVEAGQTIKAMTLTLTNVTDGASEQLNVDGTTVILTHGTSGTTASNALSYSVSVVGTTATVSLTGGTLSTAAAQTLIDGMSYQNNSDTPGTSTRVVTLTSIQDSGGTTNGGDDTASLAVASTVTVVGVNDEPTLTATGSNPTYTEGGAAASLFSGTSISTVEAGQTISELSFTITNVTDGSNERVNADGTTIVLTHGTNGSTATNSLNYWVMVIGTTATITMTAGTLSTAAAQTLIDGMSYQNTSDTPSTSNRVVTLTSIRDSGGTTNGGDNTGSLAVASTVSVVETNDEPTLTATGSNPTFTEGGASASLFSGSSISTVEAGQTIKAMTLTLTDVTDGASEQLNVDGTTVILTHGTSGTTASNALSYSVSVVGTTATVSLTGGTLSTAAAQTLIDGMSYQNNSDTPGTSTRVVTLTSIQDSGGTTNGGDDTASLAVASTVTVVGVNDEPTLTATGSNPTYTEGGAAASLFSGTSISTVEAGQTISELSFTITNVTDGSNERVNADGTTIVLTHGTNGSTATNSLNYWVMVIGTTATITMTAGTLSTAAAQTLIDGMSYQNTSDTPSTSNRVVTLTSIRDSGGTTNGGDNTGSLAVASTVSVVETNDEPTLTATGSNPTFTEGGASASLFSGSSISTVEVGQTIKAMTLTLTNVTDGASERLNVDGTTVILTHGTSGTTASNALSYSVSVVGTTATVSLTGGTLTTAAAQTLIDGMSYQNNSDTPGTSTRVVTLTSIQDSGGTTNGGDDTASLAVASTVTVVGVNDEPIVDLNGDGTGMNSIAAYSETLHRGYDSAGGVAVASGLVLSDPEDDEIDKLAVTILNPQDGADERLYLPSSEMPEGIAIQGNGSHAVTLVRSTGTTVDLVAAARSLLWQSDTDQPTTSARNVTFTPQTGGIDGNTATTILSVADDAALPQTSGPLEQIIAENGVIRLDGTGATVRLDHSFTNPIVFARTTTMDDPEPVTVRITDIQSSAITMELQQPGPDGSEHGAEEVSWFVFEAGQWELDDGTRLEVGSYDSSTLTKSGFDQVAFTEGQFTTQPVILSQVQAAAGTDWAVTRQGSGSATGFTVALQEEEAKADSHHMVENLGWLAIEPGSGDWSGRSFDIGTSATRISNDAAAESFSTEFSETPSLLTGLRSFYGPEPAFARVSALTEDGYQVRAQEETTADAEVAHHGEFVDHIALAGAGLLAGHRSQPLIGAYGTFSLDGSGGSVTFEHGFVNPVVIARIGTDANDDPVIVRVDDVTSSGFSAKLRAPSNVTGLLSAETVSWIAIETGVWTLADGTVIAAGQYDDNQLSSDGITRVEFDPLAFDATPAVISQVQTDNSEDWLVTRQNLASSSGVNITMQTEELSNYAPHGNEDIGWIAIERGTGASGDEDFASGTFVRKVEDAPFAASFPEAFDVPPVLLTQASSFFGPDPTVAQAHSVTSSGFTTVMQEETTFDTETEHLHESLDWLALTGDGRLTGEAAERVIAEVGTVSVSSEGTRVTLSHDFENPVVFALPPGEGDAEPVASVITHVGADHFELTLQEPRDLDGHHGNETVSWLVVEAGSWELPDGTRIEANTLESDLVAHNGFESVTFAEDFSTTPAILSQVQTNNDPDWTITRQQQMSPSGFDLAMQMEQALYGAPHSAETLGWLAIEPGSGSWGGHDFAAGTTLVSVTDDPTDVMFGQTFASSPKVLASLATYLGPDSASLRAGAITTDTFTVRIMEETSFDSEIVHLAEAVSWLALDAEGLLTGSQLLF